jgi:hypothetical protein
MWSWVLQVTFATSFSTELNGSIIVIFFTYVAPKVHERTVPVGQHEQFQSQVAFAGTVTLQGSEIFDSQKYLLQVIL